MRIDDIEDDPTSQHVLEPLPHIPQDDEYDDDDDLDLLLD
jgi:hypothetical protein